MKLTEKQKAFCDYYLESLNLYESAIKAGYSENYSKAQSYKLLENVGIKNYIDKRMKEKEKDRIASQDEVLEYLTRVVRGQEREQEIKFIEGEPVTLEVPAALRDRTKAAELLGKRYALFVEKQEHSGPGGAPLNVVFNIPRPKKSDAE